MKTIKQAFNAGMEAFAKHCLTYGTITHDKSMQDSGGKHWREYELIVQGEQVYLLKCNGEVIRTEIYEACHA